MMMGSLWVRRGIVALGLLLLLPAAGHAQLGFYTFHHGACPADSAPCRITEYDFEQVVKFETSVANLAVSLVGYGTFGFVDTGKVKGLF